MMEQSIAVIGLPESGKTTFLAALWALIFAREVPTAMSFERIGRGNISYLNRIAALWRNAEVQNHTEVGSEQNVVMNFNDRHGGAIRLTFPDLSGESFQRLWEERDCDAAVVE